MQASCIQSIIQVRSLFFALLFVTSGNTLAASSDLSNEESEDFRAQVTQTTADYIQEQMMKSEICEALWKQTLEEIELVLYPPKGMEAEEAKKINAQRDSILFNIQNVFWEQFTRACEGVAFFEKPEEEKPLKRIIDEMWEEMWGEE